jgi:fluoride exporter
MLLSLALGGVVGTLARYELGRWVHGRVGTAFPWGTLLINVLGCFAPGFLTRVGESTMLSPEARGMLTVGFCGALTTFSTFSYETVRLIQDGEAGKADRLRARQPGGGDRRYDGGAERRTIHPSHGRLSHDAQV